MFEIKGKYSTAKVMIDQVEPECIAQIIEMINHPSFSNPVAIMPDTHSGKGSVIGFTMEMSNQIIPSIVGVDIACGVTTMKLEKVKLLSNGEFSTPSTSSLSRKTLDDMIRSVIPFGKEVYDSDAYNMKYFPWDRVTELNRKFVMAYKNKTGQTMPHTIYDYKWFEDKCKQIGLSQQRAERSLGTLGGGNHYIEVNQSLTDKSIWVTVHTGSRQFGKCICDYWTNSPARSDAIELKNKLSLGIEYIKKTCVREDIQTQINELKKELGINNVKTNHMVHLARIEDMYGYLTDMIFTSMYACVNRDIILSVIRGILGTSMVEERIETIHNYIDFNDFIIRKGAVAAHKDQKCIIPLNMEDGSLICVGKGNPEWNYSAPHGAGRLMSRSAAKKVLNLGAAEESMKSKDIYSSSIPLDEVKGAYKDPKVIEDAIEPTVDIIDRLIPLLNLKDGTPERED
jgi:RNA-splicing ligase RtcB